MRKSKINNEMSRFFVILGVFLLGLTACDKELAEIDQNKVLRKISIQEQELINATNQLSLDLLKAEYTLNNEENTFFSPVSVGMALGMIYNGVGELEKAKIQQVMNLNLVMEKELNKSYNELLSFFHVANDQFNISYANSLWFPQDVSIDESYRTKVMAYYDAEITELNFRKPSALEYINSWGSLKTNGSFEQLLKSAPSNPEDIFLINAFGLNANWKQADDIFRSRSEFYLGNGAIQQVSTINWQGADIRFNELNDYSYFEIPFENDLVLLTVIQPEGEGSLNTVFDDLSLDDLDYLRSSAYDMKANVSLPEIDFSTDKSIRPALSSIGLNDLFLSSTNLSPSFGFGNRKLSEINHLSKIETNNKLVGLQRSATFSNQQLMAVTVDHPFVYFVRDKHTNTLLFAGYYSSPAGQK